MAAPKELHTTVEWMESRGKANALSGKGARGPMQVMDATARSPGYGITPIRNNSVAERERVGHEYLDALYDTHGGDPAVTLAAYNAGPGAVQKHKGVPPYKETQNYVKEGMHLINLHQQHFGAAPQEDDFVMTPEVQQEFEARFAAEHPESEGDFVMTPEVQAEFEARFAAEHPEFEAVPKKEAEPERTVAGTLSDIGTTTLKGGLGAVQAGVGITDIFTGGRTGKAVEDAGIDMAKMQEELSKGYSPAQQAAIKKVEEAHGITNILQAYKDNPSAVVSALGEAAPEMVAMGLIGKLAKAAKVVKSTAAAVGIGEGVETMGSNAEQLRSESKDKLLHAKQTGAALGSGAVTGVLGTVGNKVATALGGTDITGALMGGARKAAVAVNGEAAKTHGFFTRLMASAFGEGVFEELPQSAQEKAWNNYANDKPLLEGVEDAGVRGLVIGSVGGAGIGALHGAPATPQPGDTETEPPGLAAQTEQAKAVDEENNAKKKAARVEDFGVAPKSKLFKSLMDADLTTQEGIDAAKAAVDAHAPDDFDYDEFDSHINAAEQVLKEQSPPAAEAIPDPTLRKKAEPWNPKTPESEAQTTAQEETPVTTETQVAPPEPTATAPETEAPTAPIVESPPPAVGEIASETIPPSSEAAPKPTFSDVTKVRQRWREAQYEFETNPSAETTAKRDTAWNELEKINKEFTSYALATEPETKHTAQSLERHLPKELKALITSGKAVLHDTQATLPGENHPPNVKGMTTPDGVTHYVANRLTPNTIESVMLHEAGVHAGMAKLVGPKLWETYKSEAMNSQDPAFIAARAAVPKSTPSHLIPEETLAHLVEHAPKHPWVRRLISAIRNWARANLGIGSKFTEADARQLAVSALKKAGPRADTAYALSSSEEAAAAAREQRIKANPPKGINKRPTNLSRTVLKIENEMFDYSSGLYNQLRPRLEAMGLATPEVQKIMAQAFQGQTVYVNSLAAQGAIQGELHYNPNTMQWEAKAGQFSITKMKDILAKHAKTQGKPFETVSGIFTDIASALRIKEFREQAAVYQQAIDMATDPKVKAMAERKFANILRRAEVEHMTDAQIATALKPLAAHPEYAEALKEWHGVRAYMVKFLVDTGRYSEKQAKAYMDATMYVPFNRLMDAKDPDAFYGFMAGGRGRSLMAGQKEHGIKGSEREVKDMVENMEKWILNSFVKGVKNAKNLELQEVVAKHFYKGAVKQVANTKNGGIKVYRHGREEYWEYEDPLLTSAFNGVNTVALPTLTMAAKFANRLRNAIVLDPLFTINQLPQDAYSAMFSSGVKNPGALLIDIAKEWVGTLKGTTDAHEHLKGIGIVGQKDTISMATEHIHELAMHGRAKKGPFAALHRALEHFANVGDNAIRQGIYVRTMKEEAGNPNAQMIAQQRAFEVINFRKRGANATLSAFMQVTPFLGAYLQATRTQLNIISGRGISPVARKEALMRLAATSAQVATFTFLYNMMLGDDDEFKKKDIQERDTHIYPFGSKSDYAMTVRADVFSLPFIAMNHVYRYLMDKGSENPYQTRQAGIDALVRIATGTPMGPTVIKPILEHITGIDFYTNRPIIPERYKHLSGTPELQYNEKTSELAKLLGHAGMSPFLVDHFIKGYFGYAGATAMMVTDMALRAGLDIPYTATREDQTNIGYGKSAKDIPGMPLRNDKMTQGVEDFYNLGGAAREAKASANRFEALGKTKDARAFKGREASLLLGRPENRRLLSDSVQREMNKKASQMHDLTAQKDKIASTPNDRLSPEAKRARIERIDMQIKRITESTSRTFARVYRP